MLFVENQNITDPRVNLALEEYLLRHCRLEEPLLLFYVNEPAVIIGRNQNTLEEIDADFVAQQGIHVVRRLSGGGAVFHDLGNLNFSFITQGDGNLHNFAKFTRPVIAVLRALGVPAELRGKSDIFANDRKISGNAQYVFKGRMFSHGTLLFDTNLTMMLRALNPRRAEIESRAVQSVRHYVANIREFLSQEMSIRELQEALLDGIFGGTAVPTYELTAADWVVVDQIANERYRTWEWNVGRSPDFNVRRQGETPAGKVEARIDVHYGRIQAISFWGNFASLQDVAEVAARLTGLRYERTALAAALAEINLAPYFGSISAEELATLLA